MTKLSLDSLSLETPVEAAVNSKDFKDLYKGTRGNIFSPDVMIVGEAWGAEEDRRKEPFVGYSGKLLSELLLEAKIPENQVFFTNLISERPPNNSFLWYFYNTKEARARALTPTRGLFPRQNLLDSLEILYEQIRRLNPRVIIACGNYPLWALTDDSFSIKDEGGYKVPTGILQWRGSQIETAPRIGESRCLVPTIHPAAVLRQWGYRRYVTSDIKGRTQGARKFETGVSGSFWATRPDFSFITRPTFTQACRVLNGLIQAASEALPTKPLRLAHDLETRGGLIACSGIAWSKTEAICIPFMCVENDEGYWTPHEEWVLVKLHRKLLTHPNVQIVGQNYNYDQQYIANEWFCKPKLFLDTMVTWHTLFPGEPKGLAFLSSVFCDFHFYWKDEGKEWEPWMDEDQLWRYNCQDACRTFEVVDEEMDLAEAMGFTDKILERTEESDLALELELRGVKISPQRQFIFACDLLQAAKEREEWLESILPSDVYPRKKKASPYYTSPKQLAEVFYEVFNLPPQKQRRKQKDGTYKTTLTTNDAALEKITKIEPLFKPMIVKIQELRSIDVFLSTFCFMQLEPFDRLCCMFDITGTYTFRWSSKENAFGRGGNLQNIPRNRPKDD